jgi:hypothetical protein
MHLSYCFFMYKPMVTAGLWKLKVTAGGKAARRGLTKDMFVWDVAGWVWLALLLCRDSCCAEEAAVSSFTVW